MIALRVLPVVLLFGLVTGAPAAANDWKPLLDTSLSQWDTYQSYRFKPGYTGKPPVDADGKEIPPIGYGKNEANVFTVSVENGERVLRISGEIYGCLFTKQEFENYHLRLKVKWGEKKWEPRTELLRDSGVLYHSIGEAGVEYWRSWMLSQEFQIMEGHMGDYWCQATSAADIRAFLPEGGIMNPVASERQPFIPIGAGSKFGGFCLRSVDRESAHGQWTQIDLYCVGDQSVHVVNGQVVMALRGSRYTKDGRTLPLTKGKLQLQSEAAEVFYKDIAIAPLPEMPAEYAALFK